MNALKTNDFRATGRIHLLWIGINRYESSMWPTLRTAVSGSEALEEALQQGFGLVDDRVLRLVNQGARLAEIERSIRAFGPGGSMELSKDDQLLISFAGHGEKDPLTHETAFVPYDGHIDSPSTWFRFDHLRSLLRVIEAKHVLVVSDSCFSGGVFRSSGSQLPDKIDEIYAKRAYASKSRLMISSGGNEIVADAGGGHGKSVFVQGILNALSKRASPWVLAEEVFRDVRKFVVENSQQTPEFGGLERSGHDGGQLVLFRASLSDSGGRVSVASSVTAKIDSSQSNVATSHRTHQSHDGDMQTKRGFSPRLLFTGLAVAAVIVAGALWTLLDVNSERGDVGTPTSYYDLSSVRFDAGPFTLKNFSIPHEPPLVLAAGHEFDFEFTIETLDIESDAESIFLFADPIFENQSCVSLSRYKAEIESNMNRQVLFGIGNLQGCSSTEVLGLDLSFERSSGDVFPALSLVFENYVVNRN